LRPIAEHLHRVPRHGAGYVPLRFGGAGSSLRTVPPSEVAVNYLGQLDLALLPDAPARVVGDILGPTCADFGPLNVIYPIRSAILTWLCSRPLPQRYSATVRLVNRPDS
jgi:hypothetical protein